MKPFDLAAALAGKPVVNGMGNKVVIGKLAMPNDSGAIITSQVVDTGRVIAFHKGNGRAEYSREFDLFMAPTTVTKWVNLYSSSVNALWDGIHNYYETEDLANHAASYTRVGGKAFQITYEE